MKQKPWMMVALGGLAVGAHVVQLRADEPKTKIEVLHCHDGDTCRIKISGAVWLNVRLAGIDAPEVKGRGKPGQPMGQNAQEFISERIKGKTVDMRQTDLDSYNRPVVELYDKAGLINLELVRQGLAEAYRGKTKRLDKSAYIVAEEEAQKAKRGIWALPDYESPATYRKR